MSSRQVNVERVRLELRKLQTFIDRPGQDKFARRLAQTAASAIRWVIDGVGVGTPSSDIYGATTPEHAHESEARPFRLGDTVIFDPATFSPVYWAATSHADKLKYYGQYGYGHVAFKRFTFICEHAPQTGHCMLVELGSEPANILMMCHTNNFRLATEDEC